MKTLHFTVPDMACSGCIEAITKAVHELDASAVVRTNLTNKGVEVDTECPDERLKQAIAAAGYTVEEA